MAEKQSALEYWSEVSNGNLPTLLDNTPHLLTILDPVGDGYCVVYAEDKGKRSYMAIVDSIWLGNNERKFDNGDRMTDHARTCELIMTTYKKIIILVVCWDYITKVI